MSPLLLSIERRLSEVLGLSPERASRALSEVLDALHFDLDEYIVTRHAQLRAEGVPNTQIYDRIAAEMAGLRARTAGADRARHAGVGAAAAGRGARAHARNLAKSVTVT